MQIVKFYVLERFIRAQIKAVKQWGKLSFLIELFKKFHYF